MEYKLPLGVCKQAILKYESALNDINEILSDEDIDDEQRETFSTIAEYTGNIIAHIYTEVSSAIGEEEFLAEQIEMDKIDNWPGENDDILNNPL